MKKIILALLLVCGSLPSIAKSESLGLRCQFIPYTSCLYTFKFTTDYDGRTSLIDNVYLVYRGDNIDLHPGLFAHEAIINSDLTVSNVQLRIRGGRVYFIERFNDHLFEQLSKFEGTKVEILIKSQRVPVLIDKKNIKVGWMNIDLFKYPDGKSNSPIASASVRMKPTNGCWLDEHSCLTYTD